MTTADERELKLQVGKSLLTAKRRQIRMMPEAEIVPTPEADAAKVLPVVLVGAEARRGWCAALVALPLLVAVIVRIS